MTYNVPLAEQTLRHIKDNPECHDQADWLSLAGKAPLSRKTMCGSTGCFMGWAVYLECYVNGNTDLKPTAYDEYYQYNGKMTHIQNIASELLGLNEIEAAIIYDGSNTIEELETMVKDMANDESPKRW